MPRRLFAQDDGPSTLRLYVDGEVVASNATWDGWSPNQLDYTLDLRGKQAGDVVTLRVIVEDTLGQRLDSGVRSYVLLEPTAIPTIEEIWTSHSGIEGTEVSVEISANDVDGDLDTVSAWVIYGATYVSPTRIEGEGTEEFLASSADDGLLETSYVLPLLGDPRLEGKDTLVVMALATDQMGHEVRRYTEVRIDENGPPSISFTALSWPWNMDLPVGQSFSYEIRAGDDLGIATLSVVATLPNGQVVSASNTSCSGYWYCTLTMPRLAPTEGLLRLEAIATDIRGRSVTQAHERQVGANRAPWFSLSSRGSYAVVGKPATVDATFYDEGRLDSLELLAGSTVLESRQRSEE